MGGGRAVASIDGKKSKVFSQKFISHPPKRITSKLDRNSGQWIFSWATTSSCNHGKVGKTTTGFTVVGFNLRGPIFTPLDRTAGEWSEWALGRRSAGRLRRREGECPVYWRPPSIAWISAFLNDLGVPPKKKPARKFGPAHMETITAHRGC